MINILLMILPQIKNTSRQLQFFVVDFRLKPIIEELREHQCLDKPSDQEDPHDLAAHYQVVNPVDEVENAVATEGGDVIGSKVIDIPTKLQHVELRKQREALEKQ